VANKLANSIWDGLLFLDHRRRRGHNPHYWGETEKPHRPHKQIAYQKTRAMKFSPLSFSLFFFLAIADTYDRLVAERNETLAGETKMYMTIQAVPGMYFSAIRNRDDKVFTGEIAKVQHMGDKGRMIVVKLQDTSKYATVYLDECYDYAWSDFPLPALVGRGE
jgi:hypothetical protein